MKTLTLTSLLLAGLSLFAGGAFAQNVRYDAPFPSISSQTSTPYLVANVPPNSPVLAVCSSPANQVPCTNYATTFTSTGAACPNGAQDTPQPQPSDCQVTGDAQGNIGFWAPPGNYDYTVCISNNCFGPFTVTLGAGGTNAVQIQGNPVSTGSISGRPGSYYATNPAGTALSLQDKNVYDTRDYGVVSDGTTNGTAAMSALLTSIGSTVAKLVFPQGTQTLLASLVFPSNVTLDLSGGGLRPITDTTPAGGGAIDTSGSGSNFSTSANSCAVTVTPSGTGRAYWLYTAHSFNTGNPSQPTSSIATDIIPFLPSFQSNTNVSMLSEGWLVSNVAAGARTFTFNYSGTGWVGCGAIAISGLGPTPSVGATASTQGSTTPMTSGSATVQSGSFILAYGGQHNNTLTCTAGSGFTQPPGSVGQFGTGGTVCTEYINSSSSGALTANQNISVSPTGLGWTFNLVELHPGSAIISILGPIIAPPKQVLFNALGGQGTVDFTGNTLIPQVYPEWWGASPSAGASVNTPALQAAEHGAFGTNRTNASGYTKFNRELWLSGNYQINDELQFYHVIGFRIACEQRANAGITQTAANKRIMDGQSMAYGVVDGCSWSTTASQTVPLLDIDYSGAQGTDLAPQFIDFNWNTFVGNGLGQIGLLLAKSGGGAQGSNVNNNNSAYSGFTLAGFQIGGNNTGLNTGRFYATNALGNTFYQGDVQSSPQYGIAVYGGSLFIRDVTFENGFSTQTGFDAYCEAVQAPGCFMEKVRSESRRLAAGVKFIKDSFTINQAFAPTPGVGAPVGTIISGSKVGGDGKYYKITVDSSGFGGVGNYASATYESATSGSSTTIVNSGASYTVSAFVGMRAAILAGTGLGEYCVVTANDATTITCAAGWVTQYSYLTIVNPDATSKFIVEPNWGTQFTSGGITWVDLSENGLEGNLAGAGVFDLNNVQVPGDRIFMAGGSRIRNLQVTRTDWCNCTNPLDDQTTIGSYEKILVFLGGGASGAGPITVGGAPKYVPWSFPRNGSSQVSAFSQFNLGTEQIVWSSGGSGGGTRNLDVGIGGRGPDNTAGTSVSRNVLPYLGMLGRVTPFGTDQAGTATQIQGGLSTGAGACGDIEFWLGSAGSTGSSVNSGALAWSILCGSQALQGPEISAPANPPAGKQRAYFKAGAGLCSRNSAGTEFCPAGATTIRRVIGYTFGDPAGSTLSTSTVGYVVAPAACTIVAWDMLVDTGTATVTTWKVATGTAIPTVANSISTSGVAISSGTAIHSTTLSDFTTTTVTANDIFGFNISAVSGAHYLYFDLQCDQ